MINPSRENLVGYLVGALEDEERAVVEDALASDLRLREELNVLGRGLSVVEADRGHYDPPPGLAARTCQFVYERTAVAPAALSPVRAGETVPYRRWSFADVGVAAGIFLAASLLMVPAIYSSRTSAQAARCQYNLARIGVALKSYSDWDKNHAFPLIPLTGNLANGRMFPSELIERKFVRAEDEGIFFCAADQRRHGLKRSIPRIEQLQAAQGEQLHDLYNGSTSYALTLGQRIDGQYVAVRDRNRGNFALVADAPAEDCAGSDNHGACGFNILCEDASVRFVKRCQLPSGDHVFMNGRNEVAPGIDEDDSVIAGFPTFRAPVIRQISN